MHFFILETVGRLGLTKDWGLIDTCNSWKYSKWYRCEHLEGKIFWVPCNKNYTNSLETAKNAKGSFKRLFDPQLCRYFMISGARNCVIAAKYKTLSSFSFILYKQIIHCSSFFFQSWNRYWVVFTELTAFDKIRRIIQQKQKAGIVTSLPDEVAYGIYEWFSSQQNTLLHIIYWFKKYIYIDRATAGFVCKSYWLLLYYCGDFDAMKYILTSKP